MTKPTTRPAHLASLAIALVAASIGALATARADAPSDAARLFRERVAPVLKAECYACHSSGAKKLGGGLRLDTREAMLQGGDSGPAVVPGKPGESLLIQAIRHQDGLAMPPKKPRLDEATIADFEAWIAAARRSRRPATPRRPPPRRCNRPREHWAFRPVAKPSPPTRRRSRLGAEPDRCLRAGEARGAGLAPVAGGHARRVAPSGDVRRHGPAAHSRGG